MRSNFFMRVFLATLLVGNGVLLDHGAASAVTTPGSCLDQ
jgi:hypothetical protein